ncbi:MAG: hypothetical protein NZL83_00110 [Candidatus Absconditabacterales bacterium]|nr:hypothetical protein [Candidatus Absconditabacterales bacterium]
MIWQFYYLLSKPTTKKMIHHFTILNEIRLRIVSSTTTKMFNHITPKIIPNNCTNPFTHNTNVDYLNTQDLDAIDEPIQSFTATPEREKFAYNIILKRIINQTSILLKVGERNMYIKNNHTAGHNNSITEIEISFDHDTNNATIQQDNEITNKIEQRYEREKIIMIS